MSPTYLLRTHVKLNALYIHIMMELHAYRAKLLVSPVLQELTVLAVCLTLSIKLTTLMRCVYLYALQQLFLMIPLLLVELASILVRHANLRKNVYHVQQATFRDL